MNILANLSSSSDARLDCIPQFDARSRLFLTRNLLEPDAAIEDRLWACDTVLDQGAEGACVGFGFAHELAAEPNAVEDVTNANARGLYKRAQDLDEWPGHRYEGTSVLAGAKACVEGKFFDTYFWATSAQEIGQALAHLGPVVIGVAWHTGMERTDRDGFIWPTGPVRGGHCVCLRGVATGSHPDGSEFEVIGRNSWGTAWGERGDFSLTARSLQTLVDEPGSAFCVPLSRHDAGTWPEARRRRWWDFFQGVRR